MTQRSRWRSFLVLQVSVCCDLRMLLSDSMKHIQSIAITKMVSLDHLSLIDPLIVPMRFLMSICSLS